MDSGANTAKKEGVDPASTSGRPGRSPETIEELFAEFLKYFPLSVEQELGDSQILRREAIPAWSLRNAKGITRGDIIRLLDKVEDRSGAPMRNRVADAIIRFFRFAIEQGAMDASPAVGVRHLDHDGQGRFLTGEEIKAFWYGLEHKHIPLSVRPALRFLLVTGRTRAEVAGAARSEIDDCQAIWRLRGMAGNGVENPIPLPDLALQIVADADGTLARISQRRSKMPLLSESFRPLFPSGQTGRAIEPASLKRALDNNTRMLGIRTPRIYDLTSTFETWHREHGTLSDVLGTSECNSDMAARRHAMTGWCAWLETVLS